MLATDDLKERVDIDARSQADQFLHWKGCVQTIRRWLNLALECRGQGSECAAFGSLDEETSSAGRPARSDRIDVTDALRDGSSFRKR
jgi:hypothetical protein